MNRLSVYKYQMHEYKASFIAFFAILLCILVASVVLVKTFTSTSSASFSGFEFSTFVFLFVIGIVTFKDSFFMMMQNGVTRKTLFTAELAAMATASIIATVYNKILLVVISLFTGGLAEMRTTYNYVFYQGENTDTISMFINSVLFEICISFVAIMVGYMIRIIFYRLNRLGKIFVGAGLPVLLFFVIPMLDYILFNGTITTTFATLLYTLLSTPLRAFGTILIAFAVCAGISYLLMRRAVVNK